MSLAVTVCSKDSLVSGTALMPTPTKDGRAMFLGLLPGGPTSLVHALPVTRSHYRSRDTASRSYSDRDWALLRASFAGVVAAVFYVAAVTWSSWYADDFLFLQMARSGNLTLSWLAVDNYGHFAPFTRF